MQILVQQKEEIADFCVILSLIKRLFKKIREGM